MKYIFLILISIIFYSWKNEYECCWYNEGVIQEDVGFCTINKLSKKEADAEYKQVNELEWKCDKK